MTLPLSPGLADPASRTSARSSRASTRVRELSRQRSPQRLLAWVPKESSLLSQLARQAARWLVPNHEGGLASQDDNCRVRPSFLYILLIFMNIECT